MEDLKMITQLDPEKLQAHIGHDIEIVTYGDQNVSLECETCNEVLADADSSVEAE